MTLPVEPHGEDQAKRRDRLAVRLFNIIEGEAEGRWAISVLGAVVLLAMLYWRYF